MILVVKISKKQIITMPNTVIASIIFLPNLSDMKVLKAHTYIPIEASPVIKVKMDSPTFSGKPYKNSAIILEGIKVG